MFRRISLLISRCDRVKWNGFTCRFQQICTGILIITLNILKKVLGCLNSSWNQLKASVFILQASFYIWHICPSIQEHSGDEKSRSERPTNVTFTTYWTRIQQFLKEGTLVSVFLLIGQQRRSHSVNHMKATHVKLKTWPQKAWSPIFPNQTLLQISLFYTRIHVVWTNLPSPASSALTGNHPLRRRHRPAAAAWLQLCHELRKLLCDDKHELSTIKFYISTKKKQRNVFLALSCWLSSRSSHTRVLPAQIWGLRSSLQTAYDAYISITLFCFYCTSVWHIGAVTEECVCVCACV